MHVLRIFSPQNRDKCVEWLQAVFRLVQATAGGGEWVRLPQRRASAQQHSCARRRRRNTAWDHGLRIDIVTMQNEPDGNPGNKPRDGSYADHQRWLREDLDSLGLQRVKIAALEWRHPPNGGIPEFDQLKAAGLIGKGKAVELGCGHVYDKIQGLDLADRLRSVGCHLEQLGDR